MLRRYRPRKEFKFWLYHDLAEDVRLMDYIDYLRKTRQFAKSVRNGLRLLWTLSEGDTSFLTELFPGIVASLTASTPPPPPDTSGIERKIDQLQQALLSAGVSSGQVMTPALPAGTVGAGIKPLAIGNIPMPTFDDDDQDTVVIRMDTTAPGKANQDFLNSALNFQHASTTASETPSHVRAH